MLPVISWEVRREGDGVNAEKASRAIWLAPLLLVAVGSAIHAPGSLLTANEVKAFYPEIFDARAIQIPGAEALRGTVAVAIAEVPEGNPLDLALEPDAFVEALVYSAIASELHVDDSPVQRRIQYALELARDLGLSTDEEVAIARAQGVVWAVLKESPEFRKALSRQYRRVGVLLPISIDFGGLLP